MKYISFPSVICLCLLISCNLQNQKATINSEYISVNLKDTLNPLIAISTDSIYQIGTPVGFKNKNQDTVIKIGKYSHCWTDTFKTFAIVFDQVNTNNNVVAINQNEQILFDIYISDNYPDDIKEGLFRVKQNGKIGFSNKYGQIIIPCIYECAYPFENGKAKVTLNCQIEIDKYEHKFQKSNDWFFIDRSGKKI